MRPSWSVEMLHRTPEIAADRRDSQRGPGSGIVLAASSGWQAAPRAVFVGRLAPEKGLDTLIDAWPAVRVRYPEARLILIGEGPAAAGAGGAGPETWLDARAGPGRRVPGPCGRLDRRPRDRPICSFCRRARRA